MDEQNPFAPLVTGGDPLTVGALAREGDQVRGSKQAEWPDRCVVCNRPAEGSRLKMTLQWHPRWVFLLLLLNVIVFAIGAAVTRKTAVVQVGLCEEHRRSRRFILTVGGAALALSVLLCAGGIAGLDSSDRYALVIAVGGIVAISGLLVMTRAAPLKVVRVTKDEYWVRAGSDFTHSLPPVGS